MEIPQEYEKFITTDDIDWVWNRVIVMTGTIVCGGRGTKYQMVKNIWDLVAKDLIDDSPVTLVDLQGFKSWFFIRKDVKLSSFFRKAMKDWYTARFANKEPSIELYNELVNGLNLIHESIKKFDHRFNNWGLGTNGTPRCIDFDGDELDVVKVKEEDVESLTKAYGKIVDDLTVEQLTEYDKNNVHILLVKNKVPDEVREAAKGTSVHIYDGLDEETIQRALTKIRGDENES